jgi:hypothetical protein
VIRQDVLLSIMDIVERAETRLAVPMQVLRIEGNGEGHDTPIALPGARIMSPGDEPGRMPGVAENACESPGHPRELPE